MPSRHETFPVRKEERKGERERERKKDPSRRENVKQ